VIGSTCGRYEVSVGKYEEKRTPERHSYKWRHNIRMHRRRIGWEVMDLIHLRIRTVTESFEHGNEPSGSIKSG